MTTPSRSRKGRNITVMIIMAVAIIAVFAVRFQQAGQTEALASVRSVQEEEGIPVETVTAARGNLATWMTLAGTVEGGVQYPVVSTNALQVVGIPVKEGDRVKAGDVIVHLADSAPSPMYHSVARSRANYDNALVEVRRLRNLFAEGAVSQSTLDAAETQLEVLAAALNDARGATTLTAREAGVVTRILVNEGDTVGSGKAVAWIADTGKVKVKFHAGSRQALSLQEGLEAVWTDPEGTRHAGALTQLDLMADPVTHLLAGEATFGNEDGRLLPGLLVSFEVRTQQREGTLLVPAAALVTEDGVEGVWKTDGTATLQPVKVGLRTEDQVEILDGVQAGDRVVLHGQTLLTDGVKTKTVGAGEAM